LFALKAFTRKKKKYFEVFLGKKGVKNQKKRKKTFFRKKEKKREKEGTKEVK
jgi:hypothetical protein